MRDWLDIGSSPPGEPCAQVGADGYLARARKECRAYVALLRRAVGPEPEGAALCVRANPHDFGAYLSVACSFETDSELAVAYAFRCESEGPEFWDDTARAELAAPVTPRKENRP